MKVYNSLTRQKEELIPIRRGEFGIYCCGPTVYNYIHVGNARPIILFDLLRRYLEYRGNRVTFVQNFTDVDDKIIRRAQEEGVSPGEVAEKYIAEYFVDAHGLGVRDATVHPRATEAMDDIIGMVKTLEEKGFAYVLDGDVYFRTQRFSEYGSLSRQPLEELEAGARTQVNDGKESPMDFALWKAAKPGEPAWESPWGPGRPGWHIECSAMSGRYLGKTVDIHCGGQDLTFPHHENEIAQSEAANGCKFVNYWMHNGFLNIDDKKMSKSEGNFFTVRDAAAAYGYESIRFFMLSAQYRSPLNYSRESLLQAQSALARLRTARENLCFLAEHAEDRGMNSEETDFVAAFRDYRNRFITAMDDDLNTADAVGVLFELTRAVNGATAPERKPGRLFARQCLKFFLELTEVLGLLPSDEAEAPDREIEAMIEARQTARAEKNFAEADRIREALKQMGVLLEDTPQGVKWKRGETPPPRA